MPPNFKRSRFGGGATRHPTPYMHSWSSGHPPRASRARPQPTLSFPNGSRLHLSPCHRLSVSVAAVGRMACSTQHLRTPQRRSLPPAHAGGSGVRLPGGGSMDYYLFTVWGGAWLQPGLELSAPLSQPPHDHVLTSTLLAPHRSLARRRLRHQRPRLDGPRSRARCHTRYRRHQPLRRPRRRPRARYACAAHVHMCHACACI